MEPFEVLASPQEIVAVKSDKGEPMLASVNVATTPENVTPCVAVMAVP